MNSFSQAPSWLWVKTFGSSNTEIAYAITTDAAGNIYSTGNFDGTVDFDPGPGVYNLTSTLGMSAFIVKLDAYGNFIWARVFNGVGSAQGSSIIIDGSGNVYSTGIFYATIDFDPGPGVFNLSAVTNPDVYISKLDSSGNFLWAKALLGTSISGNPPLLTMVIDEISGSAYTTGLFSGTVDFDPSVSGTYNLTSNGSSDVFILKLDVAGNFMWAKSMGGNLSDSPNGIALDPVGNIYCAGRFNGTADFDPGAATFNLTSAGSGDVFIAKLSSSGNFIWGKRIGGTSLDISYSMVSDHLGNVYTTGDFGGTADFDPGTGTFNLTAAGSDDYFVSKMDSAGNLVWAKAFGGMGIPVSHALAVDSNQNVYTTGYFSGTSDFDPGTGVYNVTPVGSFDIFVCKQDPLGNFDWVKTAGGSTVDNNFAVAFNPSQNGSVYIAGDFSGTNCFFGSINPNNVGGRDIYIAKLGTCSAHFTIYPDTVPQMWIGVNQAEGVPPLTYLWSWGDGSANSSGPAPSHTYATAGFYNICLTITDATGCTSTYCDNSTYLFKGNGSSAIVTINFMSSTSVGIQESSENEDFIFIAPNPTNSYFTISGLEENDDLSIINILGERQTFCCNNSTDSGISPNQKQIKIEVADWRAGLYIIRVVTKNGIVAKKVIVY